MAAIRRPPSHDSKPPFGRGTNAPYRAHSAQAHKPPRLLPSPQGGTQAGFPPLRGESKKIKNQKSSIRYAWSQRQRDRSLQRDRSRERQHQRITTGPAPAGDPEIVVNEYHMIERLTSGTKTAQPQKAVPYAQPQQSEHGKDHHNNTHE